MRACCPVCDRLCVAQRARQSYRVEPHKQPTCPECGWLATFVTDETPGVDPSPITASGHYTCLNRHTFVEPVDGPQCTGHKRTI